MKTYYVGHFIHYHGCWGQFIVNGVNMIYVDELEFQKVGGRKKYCHMFASDLDSLHAFAKLIGRKRCWYHKMRVSELCHYDLDQKFRDLSIQNGAKEIKSKDYVRKVRFDLENQN